MKMRIKYAEQVVGLFVILALVMSVIFAIIVGINQRWFTKDLLYRTVFTSASGIAVGTPITLKGFEIGKISKIYLNEQSTIDVDFLIYENYTAKVKKNSVIELITSPIGIGGGLVFHSGLSDDLAEPGSLIFNADSEEAQELIAQNLVDIPQRDDTITRLIGSVNRLLDGINRTVSHVNQAFENKGNSQLKDIVTSVNTSLALVPGLMNEVNGLLGSSEAQVEALVQELTVLLGGVDGIISSTGEEVPRLLAQVETLLSSILEITSNLEGTTQALADPTGLVPKLLAGDGSISTFFNDNNRLFDQIETLLATVNRAANDVQRTTSGIQNEVPKISSLIMETRAAIEQATGVLEGVGNNPLLRGGISEKPVQESRSESLRRVEF